MLRARDQCEREVSLALSRYVGYTTGAYDIDRIGDLTTKFDGKPSLLEIEISQILQSEADIGSDYATGIINFGVGLGFIQRYDQAGRLAKIGLTPLGRIYRASVGLNHKELKDFLLTYSVLQYDCDIYGLLLDLAVEKNISGGEGLHSIFLNRTIQLRETRCEWLMENFPNRILRDRITRHVQWIKSSSDKSIKKIVPGADFARHHATPRKGWAKSLDHIDNNGSITEEGRLIIERLRSGRSDYFWLGPPERCFSTLHIPKSEDHGPFSPAWNILRPLKNECITPDQFIEDVALFMQNVFQYIRLVRSNQAPLEAITPFVYFLEKRENIRINEDKLFIQLFSNYRDQFAPMSKRTGMLGHYQLRKSF